MDVPAAAPNAAQVTEMFRSAPWASQINVAGVPVKRLVDKQVRIALAGEGRPVERRLVPETKAAEQLLSGPQGGRITEAIRGYLSLADQAGDVPVRVEGLAFADTVRGVALNTVISTISDPTRSGLPFTLRPDLSRDEISTLQATVDSYHSFLKDSPDIALSPPYMSFGQNVTRRFLEYAGKDASTIPAAAQRQAFKAAGTMAHELNHRVSPADFTGMSPENMGVLQMFEEGSTEVATSLPGMLDTAARAMGMPTPPDGYRGPFGYPQYVDAFSKLLKRADIDVADASDNKRAYELLQGESSNQLPSRLTDAIAQAHAVPDDKRGSILEAVNAIGAGAGPIDSTSDEAFGRWAQKFDANLESQLTAIDSIIAR